MRPKTPPMLPALRISLNRSFLAAAALGLASASAHAATLYWDGTDSTAAADGGAGTWNTSSTNWDTAATGGANATWNNATPDSAVFGGAAGTVTLGTGITAGGLAFTTTGYTVTGNTLTLGNATVGVDTGSGVSATIGSILAGTNTGLVKTGAGTLTLSGANTFTGNLAVNAGTVAVTSSGNLGAGTVSIASGATLNFTHTSGTQTVSRAISGTGNFVKDGAGVLVLNGVNTFSGSYTLTAGDLVFTGTSAEDGAPSLVINGGRFYLGGAFAGAVATMGNLSGAGGRISTAYEATTGTRTLSVNQTADATYSGILENGSSTRVLAFTKTGAATLTLAGGSSFTGPVNIQQGILKIGNSSALGAADYAVTKVVIGSGATLDVNGFADTKYGVTLAGGSLVNTGAATARNLIQTPNLLLTANSTVGGTGDFALIASGYGANSLDLAGFTLTKTGTNSIGLASTTATAGTIRVEGGAIEMGISNAGTGFTGAATTVNLAAAGATLTVTKASTLGALTAGAGTVLALNNTLTLGALNPNTTFGGDITGTGGLVLAQAGTFTFDRATDGTVAAVISGVGSVGKTGAGKLTLTGANTYTGGTSVTGGTLAVSGSGKAGAATGVLNVSGGGAFDLGGTSQTFGAVTVNNGSLLTGTLTGASFTLTDATVSSSLSGAGALVSSGNTVLSGTNNYTGTTSVTGGTLTLGAGGATGAISKDSAVLLSGGGTLAFNRSDDFEFSNVINGDDACDLRQSGTGVLTLAGDKSGFLGTTVVTAGTLRYKEAAARPTNFTGALDIQGGTLDANNLNLNTRLLTGSGTVAMGTGTLTLLGFGDSTFSGNIAGTGALVVDTGTTLRLAGDNTSTGATTVRGELWIGNGGSTGSLVTSAVTVEAGAFLVYDRSDSASVNTFGVSGAGTLASVGSGSVTHSGVVDGASVFQAGPGTLFVTNAANRISSVVVGDGRLELVAASVTGPISVSGGQGRIIGSIEAPIEVIGGQLILGSGVRDTLTRVGATPDITVNAPGVLTLAYGTGGVTLTGLKGDGTLENFSSHVTLIGDNSAFTGTLLLTGGIVDSDTQAGLGGVTLLDFNSGTLRLGSASTLSVAVHATDGTVSYLNSNAIISFAGAVLTGSGDIVNNGTGLFDLTGADLTGFTGRLLDAYSPYDFVGEARTFAKLEDPIPGVGRDYFNSSATDATMTLNQDEDSVASGQIRDNISLVKNGEGTLVLTGANIYTGTTTVNFGVVRVGAGGTTGSIGSGAVTLNAGGTLSFDRSDEITVNNAISGDGTLEQRGTGTATFAGPVDVGVLSVAAGSRAALASSATVGTLAGAGEVRLDGASILTVDGSGVFDGSLTGTGSLLKTGSGTFVLAGTSTLATRIEIATGTLQVGNGGTSGDAGTASIVNNGTLAVNRADTVVLANAISGTGAVTQSGAGRTVLTGDNTYLGRTTVAAGILQVGDGGTTGSLGSGAVVNDATLVFNRADDVSASNAITGTGSLVKEGSGKLTLTGPVGYSGDTVVNAGTLALGTATLPGGAYTVASGALLSFNGTGAATLQKGVSGAGDVEFNGSGATTTLQGDSAAHTGRMVVSSGHTLRLGVDASSPAPVLGSSLLEISQGATLLGSGRLSAGSLVNRGTVSPGFSPGLLVLAGDFTNTGTLNMEIAGAGGAGASTGHDQILFGGTANLDGTLNIAFTNGFAPADGFSVVLLADTNTADGKSSFSGNFATVSVTGAVGRIVTSSSGTIAFFAGDSIAQTPGLVLSDGALAFAEALSPSQTAVHPALADFIAITDPAARARALTNSSPVGLAALTALPVSQACREADALRQRVEAQAQAARTPFGDGGANWLAYAGGNGGIFDNDDAVDAPTFDTRSFGGFAGLERRLGDGSLSLGLRLGYDRGSADLHDGAGDIDQDHARATFYGTALLGDAAYVTAGLGMGYSSYETKRHTVNGTQTASPTGLDVSASVDAGYVLHINREWTFTPHAGASVVRANVSAFTESGSDLALSVDGYSHTAAQVRVGTALMREWAASGFKRDAIRFGVDVSYEHTLFGETVDIPAAFATVPQVGSFTSESAALVRDRLVVGPQLEWVIDGANSISAGARYEMGFDGSKGYRGDLAYEYRF